MCKFVMPIIWLIESCFTETPDLQIINLLIPTLTQLNLTQPGYLKLRSLCPNWGQAPQAPLTQVSAAMFSMVTLFTLLFKATVWLGTSQWNFRCSCNHFPFSQIPLIGKTRSREICALRFLFTNQNYFLN